MDGLINQLVTGAFKVAARYFSRKMLLLLYCGNGGQLFLNGSVLMFVPLEEYRSS